MMIGPVAALAVTGCGSGNNATPATPSAKPAASGTAPAKTLETDTVTLDDFAIKPAITSLKAGKIEFKVRNKGKTSHEFVVLDTRKKAAALGHGSRVPEAGHVGETGNVAPGTSKTLVLNLRKGHYAVICNDPGHYMAGMHRDLYVS
jgi:uncharacterized cupredoxin-like copper-binding protein